MYASVFSCLPTLFKNLIKTNMASSTTVGAAVVRLSFDGKNVKTKLDDTSKIIESSGKKTGGKWGTAWAVAAGNLITKGISKIASTVINSMESAISRLDTLNNFPKVMTSLGYSAEEADSSISKIGDSLDGLPTSLDGMAGDVQKLAATMGNLAAGEVNATSVGLGLNDMLLAGGASTDAASAAMEQYNQMLANGKVDMQSWRSIVNAAPGQIDQLAKSILGANANQADLYAAMQEGAVSFDVLNMKIVELDKQGGEGFASYHDQAIAATGGVATQIENISNTMNKIVASALEGNLDDMGKYISQLVDRIGTVVPTLIQGFTGAFGVLIQALPGIINSLLPTVMNGITQLVMALVQALPMFVDAIVQAIPTFIAGVMQLLDAIVQALPTIIPQLMMGINQLVITAVQTLSQPQYLTLILQGAITLFLSIVQAIPDIIVALIDALPSIIDNIIAFLTDPGNIGMILNAAIQLFLALVMAVPKVLGSLLGAFGSLVGSLWNGITSMFGQFAANFGNFLGGIFKGAINGVLSFIESFINAPIDLLNGFIGIINDNFGWIGVNIGYIGRINLPRLATGGVVNSATTTLIGEAGKEAVLPLENNTDYWAVPLATTLIEEMDFQGASTAGITIEKQIFEIKNEMDAADIGRVMMQSIRRAA